jgi:hypothetical protein
MKLEGLRKLKKKLNGLIKNQTHGLPACSVVPQPTTLEFRTMDKVQSTSDSVIRHRQNPSGKHLFLCLQLSLRRLVSSSGFQRAKTRSGQLDEGADFPKPNNRTEYYRLL